MNQGQKTETEKSRNLFRKKKREGRRSTRYKMSDISFYFSFTSLEGSGLIVSRLNYFQ